MSRLPAASVVSDSPHLGGPHTGDSGTDKGDWRKMKEKDTVMMDKPERLEKVSES